MVVSVFTYDVNNGIIMYIKLIAPNEEVYLKDKILKIICSILVCLLVIGMILPTWTPHIEGQNSIQI